MNKSMGVKKCKNAMKKTNKFILNKITNLKNYFFKFRLNIY